MKIAVLWGTVFGIFQILISLVVSVSFSSPAAVLLACVGGWLSFALTVACGLIAAFQARAFGVGFWAGLLATGFDIVGGLIGYLVNPALLQTGLAVTLISFVFSFVLGIVLSAVGAGIGIFLYRQFRDQGQAGA